MEANDKIELLSGEIMLKIQKIQNLEDEIKYLKVQAAETKGVPRRR